MKNVEINKLINPSKKEIIQISELADRAFIRFATKGLYYRMFKEVAKYWQLFPTCVIRNMETKQILAFASLETPDIAFLASSYSNFGNSFKYYILGIAVDQPYRKNGFGKLMMQWIIDFVIQEARNKILSDPSLIYKDLDPLFQIWLTAAPDNKEAIPLFKSFGFEFCNEKCGESGKYETGVKASYLFKNIDSEIFV